MDGKRSSDDPAGASHLPTATAIAFGDSLPKTLVAPPKASPPTRRGPARLTIGAVVGRYVVVSELGAGGMVVVSEVAPRRPDLQSSSWATQRIAVVAGLLALLTSAACRQQEVDPASSGTQPEVANAEPIGQPAPPSYGPHLGPDFIARYYANSVADVVDLPRPELTEHYPEGRPLSIIDSWTTGDCADTMTGEPITCVVRCNSSEWADKTIADFDAVMLAASARGFERVESEGRVEFVDAQDGAGKPLAVSSARALDPREAVAVAIEVVQCRSYDVDVARARIDAVTDSDWRYAPIRSLGADLGVQSFGLSYGRRNEQAFMSGTFVFETPTDALQAWIDEHGLARPTPSEGYVVTRDGYELGLILAGWEGGAMALLSVTTAWAENSAREPATSSAVN